MTWNNITFPFGSILTSSKMTNLFDNFSGLANQDSGAPQLWNAYNSMHGFDMDHISNVDSVAYPGAIAVHEGRCLSADESLVIKLETSITKSIGSGQNYSFGNSGGSVPSSLSAIWPVVGSADSYQWFPMFLMKNTATGSMDWGLDVPSEIYSATNLMIEVNSVNNGGWDSFRRLASVFIHSPDQFFSFTKRHNIFQRNTSPYMVASVGAVNSFFPFPKIGPTGIDSLIHVEYRSSDRSVPGSLDVFSIVPFGVSSGGGPLGQYGSLNGMRFQGQQTTLMTNSGNCEVLVTSDTSNPNVRLMWWVDPYKP